MNKLHMLFTVETPISHKADERMETTSIVRYNSVRLADGRIIKQYNVSAGSFRSAIRRNAASRLLELVGMTPEEIPEICHVILFSGGPRLESSETMIPLEYKRDIYKYFPIIKMLGTTTLFCMLEGELKPTALNVLTLDSVENCLIDGNVVRVFDVAKDSLSNTVVEFQFNAKKESRVKIDSPENAKKDSECGTVANIFDQQLIMKGDLLGNRVLYENELTGSCFASALAEWQRNGGFLGGQTSQGNGAVSFRIAPDLPSPDIYENYIRENKEVIKKIIEEREIWKNKKALASLLESHFALQQTL